MEGNGVPEAIPGGSGSGLGNGSVANGSGQAGNGGNGVPVAAEARNVRLASSVAMPAIEKLKGRENYSTWAFSMRMTLIREGSWPAVRRAEGEIVSEDLKERALATICLGVESTNFGLIMDEEDPKEVWKKLAASFQDKGLPRKFGLLRKLTSIRLEDCSSVEEYVNELMTTSHKLASIGFKVDDDWLVALLFMGLPSNYEPMVMCLEASGAALTPDSVKAKILQDVKLEKGPSCVGYENALCTRGASSSRTREQQQTRPEKRCYICDKPGHFAVNCPERRSEKSKPAAWFSAAGSDAVRAGAWYFDSGASCHMARPEQYFDGEKPVGLAVGTANNGSMQVVSRGNVTLECPDGDLDIHGVLKVPDLTTNLLSVSKICKKGHTVIFTAKKCTVLDEDGNLVASGREEGGLYRLEESKLSPKVEQTVEEQQVNRPERAFLVSGTMLSERMSEPVAEDSHLGMDDVSVVDPRSGHNLDGEAAVGQAAVVREPGSGRLSGCTIPASVTARITRYEPTEGDAERGLLQEVLKIEAFRTGEK